MIDGAVFFAKPTEYISGRLLVRVEVDRWNSELMHAAFIFFEGSWRPIEDDQEMFVVGTQVVQHYDDYWPLGEDGKRLAGHMDTDLLTVALRGVEEVRSAYSATDSLEGWRTATCGKLLATTLFEQSSRDLVALLLKDNSVVQARYPSRWSRSKSDCRERDRRKRDLKERFAIVSNQQPEVELQLIPIFESVIQPLRDASFGLPEKVKSVRAFILNSRFRAAQNAEDVGDIWLKGYQVEPPSETAIAVRYARSLEIEIQRARDKITDLKEATVARIVGHLEAANQIGPLIPKNVVLRYDISPAKLKKGKDSGELRGATVKDRWLWSQDDIRKAAGMLHLKVQLEHEIPAVDSLFAAYDACKSLTSLFDPTCKIDIALGVSFRSLSIMPITKRRYPRTDGSYQRYWAHDVFAWFQSPEYLRLRKATTQTKQVQERLLVPPRPRATTSKSDARLTVFTSSKGSKGYQDFLFELGSNIPHNVLSLGVREDAIVRHLDSMRFDAGAIICIVRGGGDFKDETFKPFHHLDSAFRLKDLRSRGVVVVTGVGHATDRVVLDLVADFAETTPTKAGQRVRVLLKEQ